MERADEPLPSILLYQAGSGWVGPGYPCEVWKEVAREWVGGEKKKWLRRGLWRRDEGRMWIKRV